MHRIQRRILAGRGIRESGNVEDSITSEELATRLRVPDYWVYESPVTSGFVRMVIASRCLFAVRSNLRDMG
jgi:hypothetical protein